MSYPLLPRNAMEGSPAKWRVSCGNSVGIVISRHFAGDNRLETDCENWCFAPIFHGHFCQLLENHRFLKSCTKRSVLPL